MKKKRKKKDEDVICIDNNNQINDENNEYDKRIWKLIKNKNSKVKINVLIKMLKEKIKSKENGVKDITFNINQAIKFFYFYNLWKLSIERKIKKIKKI